MNFGIGLKIALNLLIWFWIMMNKAWFVWNKVENHTLSTLIQTLSLLSSHINQEDSESFTPSIASLQGILWLHTIIV